MDPSLRFGLRVMSDLVPATSKTWLRGSANAALPLTVMLAIYQQCTQPLLDAPLVSAMAGLAACAKL